MRIPKPPRREAKAPKRIKRSKRVQKVKKTSRAKLGRIADKEWSHAVEDRDRGCKLAYYLPHHYGQMESHHVYGKKAHPRLRYDVENGVRLCSYAHNWAHANRDEFRDWFAAEYPERWARLQAKAQRESRLA